MKLEIELVPKTVWFSSIYQFFKKTIDLQNGIKLKTNFLKERDANVIFVVPERVSFRLMNSGNMMMKSIFKS